MQDINLHQLKLKVNNIYKKDETVTKKFEHCNDENVVNKASLDTKLSKIEGHVSFIGKDYNEFELLGNKQSVEEILTGRALKRTIQIPFHKGLFGIYDNIDEVLKNDLFVERRRSDINPKPDQ